MADGVVAPAARRHVMFVETASLPDALAKILAPLAMVQAPLEAVDYRLDGAVAFARLELGALDAASAERLRARLAAMPIIRSVGLGWREA